ncbi:sorting nexin-16-like [Anopheles cruzii]|uniref:sorting nexin-16-like n=1 Tax=Anopheles cruzii TaxID=68878 RepID=UPI0022EC89E3|nr:sorting nexin-16-like [Anopheles cruzii]
MQGLSPSPSEEDDAGLLASPGSECISASGCLCSDSASESELEGEEVEGVEDWECVGEETGEEVGVEEGYKIGHGAGDSRATITPPSKRLYESRRTSELSASDFGANKSNNVRIAAAAAPAAIRIPIVGYEVMEERARFTIFKLRIENSISHSCWLVLRRYTDFVRLNNKLKSAFPHCNLVLPRKKWFGDNFSTGFIDNRIQGLQAFINIILGDDAMRTCQAVRDFFCLDEPPPSYSESMEESRVVFEAQEERISELRQQLQTKEDLIQTLQKRLATETNRNTILSNVLRNTAENCAKCAKCIDQQLKESVYK